MLIHIETETPKRRSRPWERAHCGKGEKKEKQKTQGKRREEKIREEKDGGEKRLYMFEKERKDGGRGDGKAESPRSGIEWKRAWMVHGFIWRGPHTARKGGTWGWME
jgi:hypothetical protein